MTADLILLVDDEPSIISLARMYLERDGFRVQSAGDGLAALDAITQHSPALVVLDLMLPRLDGFEVCRRLRSGGNSVPVIMLTARDEDTDKIVGLELGADDYLTKPFNPRELVARIKAILRRVEHVENNAREVVRVADLEVDGLRREARSGGRLLDLRTQEFELLLVLAGQPGRAFSRDQLLQQAWGFDFFGQTRTVDVHIAHLRKKLSGSACRIETITGIGYKLVAGG
jgi:two-component system, OmpR family, alkaline phosphatase synthesis response regulator PhoP